MVKSLSFKEPFLEMRIISVGVDLFSSGIGFLIHTFLSLDV
jgi:hypothetical protein